MSARAAIMAFLMTAALDGETGSKVVDLANQPSPVDAIVKTAEYLYSKHADLDDAGRDLVGSLAAFASANFWHGMADDNRGNRISLAMRRENGETPAEGSSFPDPTSDPTPLAEYTGATETPPAPPTS